MLTLNLNLLYTVVNILVMFLLLRKFLYKPVMNIIAQAPEAGGRRSGCRLRPPKRRQKLP